MNARQLVENWLRAQGFRSSVDSDGDLNFRYEGVPMFCSNDDNDPLFLRIFLPGIYTVKGDREKVLEAISTINREFKAVKAFLVEDHLWISLEMYVDSTPDIDDFIERCLDILVASVKRIGAEILD